MFSGHIAQWDISLLQFISFLFRNIVHPNIVRIYEMSIGIHQNGNKYLKLCMEHCPESLEDIILKKKHVVPCCTLEDWNTTESESKEFYISIMSGVSSGLVHLHEKGFKHKDLKMSNVFVSLILKML